MRKIVLTLVIALALLFSFCYAEGGFTDLSSSHWAYDTILKMKDLGLIKGYDDGTFKSEKEVTREECAQMLYSVVGMPAPNSSSIQKYFDVADTRWSYNAIQVVGSPLKETSDGYVYFYPTRPIQRQEVAKLLSDYFKLDLGELNLPFRNDGYTSDYSVMKEYLTKEVNFEDVSSIGDEYLEAVCNVYHYGLMKGVSTTKFAPEKSLTRAEAATLLYRISNSSKEEPISNSDADLNIDFLKLENNKKNIIYSPLSIKYALKMLSDGADGKTKAEIDALVGNLSLTKYKSIDKVLSLANSMFIRDSYAQYIKEEYKNQLVNSYDAEVIPDAFQNANNVNSWIENKTLGIIKNMISDNVVQNPAAKLILINALAIDMEWEVQLSEPYSRDFHKEDGSVVQAATISEKFRNSSASYYLGDDVTAISMNLRKYDDVQLEFLAIMPKEKLSNYINTLKPEDIDKISSNLKTASNSKGGVIIRIPKFAFTYDLKLKEDLDKLGIKDAFSEKDADLTNMTNNPIGLYVSDALHKADIKFSQKGIKAAAVTALIISEKSAFIMPEPDPIEIDINKPFLFMIRDKATNEVWFTGAVYSPDLMK